MLEFHCICLHCIEFVSLSALIPCLRQCYQWFDVSLSLSRQFLMPGFVDAHNHPPQYGYTGTGYDMSIEERLERYKIPTEAKFADVEMARNIYPCAVVSCMCNEKDTWTHYCIHTCSCILLS